MGKVVKAWQNVVCPLQCGEGLEGMGGNPSSNISDANQGQVRTVQNDYAMTLNEKSEVEEATNEESFVPETRFKFVPIDQLGPYVNKNELVHVIGIVQNVSPTMSIRRKSNNETVPKRDITIADETYDSEGKDVSLAPISPGTSSVSMNGMRSVYSDLVSLSHITSNPSLGEDKPAFFSIRAHISYIKHDQTMWYRACKTCNKKVTESIGTGYWCEGCRKIVQSAV